MAYTKEILTLAVEIGDCMLRNGAEIYRVEDTVVHILSSYEVENLTYMCYQTEYLQVQMRTRRMPAASCATSPLVLSIWQKSAR